MKFVSFDSLGVLHLEDRQLLDLVSGGSGAHGQYVGVNPKCNGTGSYQYDGVNGLCAGNAACPTNDYCVGSIDFYCYP